MKIRMLIVAAAICGPAYAQPPAQPGPSDHRAARVARCVPPPTMTGDRADVAIELAGSMP